MRNLSHYEACAVSGGLFSAQDITYYVSNIVPAAATLGYQVGLKSMGVSTPGIAISYGLVPVANIVLGRIAGDVCKYYLGEK